MTPRLSISDWIIVAVASTLFTGLALFTALLSLLVGS